MKPGDLLRTIRGGFILPDPEYWTNDETGTSLPLARMGELVFAVKFDGSDSGSWVRVIHPAHGIRDILLGDLEPVNETR